MERLRASKDCSICLIGSSGVSHARWWIFRVISVKTVSVLGSDEEIDLKHLLLFLK